jgi:hypothetical protein
LPNLMRPQPWQCQGGKGHQVCRAQLHYLLDKFRSLHGCSQHYCTQLRQPGRIECQQLTSRLPRLPLSTQNLIVISRLVCFARIRSIAGCDSSTHLPPLASDPFAIQESLSANPPAHPPSRTCPLRSKSTQRTCERGMASFLLHEAFPSLTHCSLNRIHSNYPITYTQA